MIALIIIIGVVGLLLYFFLGNAPCSTNSTKGSEVGRIAFAAAIFAFCFGALGQLVHIFGR